MFHVIHRTPMGVIFESDVQASSIQEVIDIYSLPVNELPTVCIGTYYEVLDDGKTRQPILRKSWDIDISEDVRTLEFITLPQGNAFKSILQLVAVIALTIVAPVIAGFVGAALGITSAIGLQLIAAGIVLAGSFLVSTFLGNNNSAATSSNNSAANGGVASPTYSISGSGNQARLFQAIPKLYGKHIIYPDYAAQTYSEYIGNDQYLNQLLCCGLGEYQIHEARIEDTVFWNETDGFLDTFTGIEMEIVPPGSPVTLFHSQVITSVEVSGQDMPNWYIDNTFTFNPSNKGIYSSSASGTETLQFRLASVGQKINVTSGPCAGTYTINSISGDLTWIQVVETIPSNTSYATTIQSDQSSFVGPYVANSADTVTNKIQVDWVLSYGMYYTNNDGTLDNESVTVAAYARKINTAGIAIGSWFTLGTHTYTRKTQTPQRITETYNVDDARYEVRVRRLSFEKQSSRYKSSIVWGGLKAFIPNDNIYSDVTLVALRMLATGQLTSSSSKKINLIQTSKLPIWNPNTNTWSAPTATRSIAWIACDIVRNDVYGASFDGDSIDKDTLLALEETWNDRGDTFNAVFDSTYSIWDALSMALRAGRTIPVMIGGTLTFVRDEARSLPRGVFNPSNIQRGTFQTQHIIFDKDSPDDVIIQFVDERTWQQNEVQCTLTDSTSENPERRQLFGITNRLQAWREGMFLAAVNAYRRVISSFTTEMEGRLLMRGDMITVAHDLYEAWGQTGIVNGYDSVDRSLYTSEPIDWPEGVTEQYIQLRKRNGSGWGPVKILPADTDDVGYRVIIDGVDLTLVQAAQGSIIDVFSHEDDSVLTAYIIVKQTIDRKDWILVSGVPKDDLVDLTCIIDDPRVHTADEGSPPGETYPYSSNSDPSRPVITFFSASEDTTSDPNQPTINFAWGASSTANSYNLRISYDNVSWQQIYSGPNTNFVGQVYAGPLFAQVQGVNTQAGSWKSFSGVFGIGSMTPLPTSTIDVSYSITGGTVSISWDAAIRATSYRVKIYNESTAGSGIYDHVAITRIIVGTSLLLNSSEVTAVGGPWASIRVGITSINNLGESSETLQTVTDISLDPVTSLSIQSTYVRSTFTTQWIASASATSYEVKIIVDGVTKITYTTLTNTQTVTIDDMTAVGGPWRKLTISVKAIAGALSSTSTTLDIIAPTILPVTGASGSYDGFVDEVNLDWVQSTDNGVNKTRVYHNTVNDFSTATMINEQTKAPGASCSYTHTGIHFGSGDHYYFITARDSVLNQESSPVVLNFTA